MSTQHFREDNYLPDERYREFLPDADGIARFQNPDDGQWYFALYYQDEVLLRSEGYANESGRDNGIDSVLRNKDDDDNYKLVQQPDGKWVLELYAKNLKEIGRTRRFDTENEARGHFPRALAAKARIVTPAPAEAKDDDYLRCADYEGHARSEMSDRFTVFTHDGEYYFALTDAAGKVQLRSEGYTTEDSRSKGIQSVLNNLSEPGRYKVEEHHGYFFVILTAANYKEIGRSCPLSEADAHALIALLTGKGAASERAREDDYLRCTDYINHPRSEEFEHFSVFTQNGEYYFALVDEDGDVQLRSEGYTTQQARTTGMQSVLNNMKNKDRYRIEAHHGYHFVILTAANHREIARSCPMAHSAAVALIDLLTGIAPVVPLAVATPLAAPVAGKSSAGWWPWLLLLLLAVFLFFLWRGCNKSAEEPKQHGVPVYLSENDCGWTPILFGFDQDQVDSVGSLEIGKVVEVLRSNASYRGLFIGFTDSLGTREYNIDLSQRRADAAKAVAVSMGVDESRISTKEEDEYNPVATNQEEAGRIYNRRVVMYVFDDQNRLVCKQVDLAIPKALEAN